MARFLMASAIVLLLLTAWRWWWQGHLAGTAFGPALFTTANIVCALVLIWLAGGYLYRVQSAKVQALRDAFENETRAAEARAEERFRLSFEQAPVGMALLDRDGTWLRVNRALCELTGYSEKELLALTHGITHPADMEETVSLLRSMKSGEIASFLIEKRYVHKLGHVLHVMVSVSAMRGDDTASPAGFVAHVVDMTEHEKVLRAYRESEARFRHLLESAPDAMVIINRSGQIVIVNSQTEKVFGYRREELLGRPVEMLLPSRYAALHRVQREGYCFAQQIRPMGKQKDLFGLRRDGDEFPVEVALSPLQVGDELLVTSAIRDVSERKRMEAELEASRAMAIQTARLTALGEMSAGIAHEVNNPLTVIAASARNLMRLAEQAEISASELRKHAERITTTSDRIARIVTSLRHIARDDARDEFREVTVLQILEECLELCQERFRVHSVHLYGPEIDPGLIVRAHEAQIGQILLNLLQNAFDAVVDQEGEKWVAVDIRVRQASVLISVIDSGPGIPAELRSRIMEPFFTTKPPGKGTGLGLSISRSIAEAHSGSLELGERADRTEFVLTLPLSGVPEER